MPQFTLRTFADVSTAHLRESDLDLLKTAPNHLAELDCRRGDFFYVPCDGAFDDFATLAKEHGMSPEFIAIFEELRRQEIPYVRFDGDGDFAPGLPIPDGRHFEVDVVEVRHVHKKYMVEANDEDEARTIAMQGDTISEEVNGKTEIHEREIWEVRASHSPKIRRQS